MTPRLMGAETKKALTSLPLKVKRDFEAWFRNQIAIFSGTNNLEADDDRLPAAVRAFARRRQRAAELALDDLHEILGTDRPADPNAHLGAITDGDRCEGIGSEESR